MSWLLHSMQLEISQSYLFLRTTKEIWNATIHTYSKKGNAIHLCAEVSDLWDNLK